MDLRRYLRRGLEVVINSQYSSFIPQIMVKEELETNTLFISTKINKIRWHPSRFSLSDGGHRGLLAVGSYDEVVNRVSIYSLSLIPNNPTEMTRLCFQNIKGGVADLKFVFDDSHHTSLLLASTFNGDLNLYNTINLDKIGQLHPEKQGDGVYPNLEFFRSLHLHQGALTSMDVSNHREVVTAGSDGDVKIVDLENVKELRKIEGDGTPINCVKYTSTGIATASNQIKLLDTRSNSQIKIRNEKGTHFQSIAPHPHQGNFLCSGAYDGTVSVWDLRSSTVPITSLNIHSNHVWELQFLAEQPDILASVSTSSLSLTQFNPSHAQAHDFGAHVRTERPQFHSISRSSLSLSSCDSHVGNSGMVAAGGDRGEVVLARLEVQQSKMIESQSQRSNVYIQ